MDSINQNLKNKIMRRVYAVWLFRKLASPFAVELFFLGALSFGLSVYVSIRNVVNNTPSIFSPGAVAGFFASAFYQAEMIVQILFVGMLASLIFLLKDVKNLISRLLFKKKETFQFASS